MRLLFGVVLIVSLMFAATANGEFYRYTDSKGDVHYVDDVNKVPKKYRKQLKDAEPRGSANVMDARPARAGSAQEDSSKRPKKYALRPKVDVFMTSWCGYCKKMIGFLNEKGIPYTAYDIEKDNTAADAYRALGVRGVPVVRVGSHIVQGYDPDAVMSYYNGGN